MMAVDPPKKRGRPPKIPSPQIGEDDIAAGLKGKAVLVPSSALAALASVHGRDTYLHGKIKGRDSGHKGCVLIKCSEDPRTFYFDIGQVQAWLEEQEQEGFLPALNADMPSGKGFEQLRDGLGQSSKRARVGHASADGQQPIGPPKKGVTKKAEVADLTGKEVDVPGAVFHDFTPGLFHRAYIMGPDSGHASAVVLRMVNNPRVRYYFHASEVRGWLRMMELRALAEDDSGMDDQDTLDDTLAAKVLAHMSAGGSSAPPSPSSSINTLQPAARSPLVRSKAQPEQQATLPAANAGCASVPPSTPRRVLLWGPTELIAQRPSLLPTSLAEQLARITSQHSNSAEATAALEAAAAHVEGHMVQGEQKSKEESNQQHWPMGRLSEDEQQQQQQQQQCRLKRGEHKQQGGA